VPTTKIVIALAAPTSRALPVGQTFARKICVGSVHRDMSALVGLSSQQFVQRRRMLQEEQATALLAHLVDSALKGGCRRSARECARLVDTVLVVDRLAKESVPSLMGTMPSAMGKVGFAVLAAARQAGGVAGGRSHRDVADFAPLVSSQHQFGIYGPCTHLCNCQASTLLQEHPLAQTVRLGRTVLLRV
jgi:hypothetical protein